MISWCVAHTDPLKELVAKQHLLNQGYEVYLPQYKKVRRHARKVEEVLRPLFPRYLFVGLNLESDPWRSVNGTQGVSHLLVTSELNPCRISTSVIENLKSQEISEGVLSIGSLVNFTKGEKVRILEGSFKDQVAIFESLDDKNRVQLLLNFLGREMKILLSSYAVEAA